MKKNSKSPDYFNYGTQLSTVITKKKIKKKVRRNDKQTRKAGMVSFSPTLIFTVPYNLSCEDFMK